MATMVLLGTGTGVPDANRGHTHMVWNGAGGPFLIDAGGSTYERLLKASINPQDLTGIMLTHSHCDHINGLPVLLFSMALMGRRDALNIYGQQETLEIVQRVLDAFVLEEYVVPVTWKLIEPGDTIPLDDGWMIRTAPNDHSRPCFASSFEHPQHGAAFTYSGDTAPCNSVISLASGCHTLIHEATVAVPSYGHTTPQHAGEVARAANVKRLVLVHFSPHLAMDESEALDAVRHGGFTGLVEIGRDNQVIEVV